MATKSCKDVINLDKRRFQSDPRKAEETEDAKKDFDSQSDIVVGCHLN